jgi:hypothetical protein
MSIITLGQAKAHLRVTFADSGQDSHILELIQAAEDHAAAYLQRTLYATAEEMAAAIEAETAGPNPMVMNSAIRAACYLLIGNLFGNREAVVDSRAAVELPLGVRPLLDLHRADLGV